MRFRRVQEIASDREVGKEDLMMTQDSTGDGDPPGR
jgi:hypothetical protein